MLIPCRPKSSASPQSEKVLQQYLGEQLITRSSSLRPGGEALALLIEGPDTEHLAAGDHNAEDSARREGFRNWIHCLRRRRPWRFV